MKLRCRHYVLGGMLALSVLGAQSPEQEEWQKKQQAEEAQQREKIGKIRQALFNPEALGQLMGKPVVESSSAHFKLVSMLGEADNKAILDHTEKAVAELGKLLGDADIFTSVPEKITLLLLGSREAYERYIQAMLEAQITDEVQAGLMRHAAGFPIGTKAGTWKVNLVDPRSPRESNAAFVAHSVVTHYLEAWKDPGKGSKPLPVWFRVGVVLMVDMRVSSHGGNYEIAYGKAETKDDFRDEAKKEDWLRIYKASKKPTPFEKVATTPFSTFTHECRAISWMACETLLELNKKKTVLGELAQKFRAASDYETCLEEVSGWNHKKLASRLADWVGAQKAPGKGKK